MVGESTGGITHDFTGLKKEKANHTAHVVRR
jgi:hypothetical protein